MFNRPSPTSFRPHSRLMSGLKYGLMLSLLVACAGAQKQPSVAPAAQKQPSVAPAAQAFSDMSGMYSFEHEGEFVQLNVEQPAKNTQTRALAVTGFISRYADTDSDRGAFLDYFITKGSLEGDKLTFSTKTIHGLSYEFTGRVVRGAVPRNKDGYYELQGTLTQNTVVDQKVVSSRSREITMKLYPEMDEPSARTK